MPRSALDFGDALALADKLHAKYRPAWDRYSPKQRAALALYFLPHSSGKPVFRPTRPRIIKWYCPFADQCDFPSGHRYCINVYTGCSHACEYCYSAAYEPETAQPKRYYQRLLVRDLEDLERFDVPPAPVHLSNSTDPLQLLEAKTGHTRMALEQILRHRHRFTTVTLLTKNPLRAVELDYVNLFQALGRLSRSHPLADDFSRKPSPGFVMEVSLAFWREDACRHYDRYAPSVADRVEGLRALQKAGIPLVLRIDPLFPRAPYVSGAVRSYGNSGLVEPQTAADLDHLVGLAKELDVRHVVYSPVKIPKPRGRKLSAVMRAVRAACQACADGQTLIWRGGSWRLPHSVSQTRIVVPFLELCQKYGVRAKYCKTNLIETP